MNPIVIADDDDEPDVFGNPDIDADGDANMGDNVAAPDGAVDVSTEDFFAGEQAVGDEYAPDYPSPNSPIDGADGQGEGEHEGGGAGGEYNDFDPNRGPGGTLTMAEAGPGKLMFDIFDETVKRNWAGPEHWKMRKPARKRTS